MSQWIDDPRPAEERCVEEDGTRSALQALLCSTRTFAEQAWYLLTPRSIMPLRFTGSM